MHIFYKLEGIAFITWEPISKRCDVGQWITKYLNLILSGRYMWKTYALYKIKSVILRIALEKQSREEINTRSKIYGRMYTEYGSLEIIDI